MAATWTAAGVSWADFFAAHRKDRSACWHALGSLDAGQLIWDHPRRLHVGAGSDATPTIRSRLAE